MPTSVRSGSGYSIGTGGAALDTIVVEDEGVALGSFDTLNFVGAGVTAADAGGGTVDVTVPGGGGGGSVLVVEAKTLTYAVLAADVGKVFTNEGAGGVPATRPFNLPTAAIGLNYTFICQDGLLLQIVAAAGDTIRLGSTVSAAAGNAVSTAVGDVVELVAINTTEWVARMITGTWTVT